MKYSSVLHCMHATTYLDELCLKQQCFVSVCRQASLASKCGWCWASLQSTPHASTKPFNAVSRC